MDLFGFFVAVPEAFFDRQLRQWLFKKGFIDQNGIDAMEAALRKKGVFDRVRSRTKNKTLFSRLLIISPHLLTVENTEILLRFGFITKEQQRLLRLSILAVKGMGKGGSRVEIAARAAKFIGIESLTFSLQVLADAGILNQSDVQKIRQLVLTSGRFAGNTIERVRKVKSLVDLLTLAGGTLTDPALLRALKYMGIIDPRLARSMEESLRYGRAMWTVFEGSKKAEGLAARMAYILSGSLSWEAVDLAEALGLLPKGKYRALLKLAVALSQMYNRRAMERYTNRRYRFVPGEPPIVSFARASKKTNQEITRLLASAAKESYRDAHAMRGLAGKQRAVRTASLHRTMRMLWEGNGYLTIFGESQAAEAAIDALTAFQKVYGRQLPEEVLRMMRYQAASGVDSYISRQENTFRLSKRVYANWDLFNGKIDKRINIHLLKGSSADEIAKDIARYISPNTPGGVSYAARRLGRTELANAFHQTSIRYGREVPWINGFKWNLSSSHSAKQADKCNQYAENDHDNLGPGIFKKPNVPDKPHPQCMCYLTMVQPDESTFIRNMKRGYYDRYMNSVVNDPDTVLGVGENVARSAANALSLIGVTIISNSVREALA